MPATPALTTALQKQVRSLEDDVRTYALADDDRRGDLEAEHRAAIEAGRTAVTFSEWLDDQVTQAAVAWVLGTVFVRFCEDNGLIDDPWLSGPGHRRQQAAQQRTAYFVANPARDDRDWLREAFAHLAALPAGAPLFDERHNPLYRLSLSGDGAAQLVAFWQAADEHGDVLHDFTDENLSTRFLGDLYQDLSESARKKYALLQTPEFVEEFILDRTLEPALAERPLDGFRMIDPACGSGHFLLGAFHRLLDRWHREAPAMDEWVRVQRALDAVHGVDLNPFAVAIARFRLTVAALQASGLRRLADAPAFAYHLAVGDALLAGEAGVQGTFDEIPSGGLSAHRFHAEDVSEHPDILKRGRYDVVVANPPYITVKDKALNEAYRKAYRTCSGKYALSVPFMELLFDLAKRADDESPAGWVGQITSNSFMKREFGAKLIEKFLSGKTLESPVDLAEVIDTSGAYIPGHGTPTVILVGRRQQPRRETVRAVLGVRGEPGRPDDPAKALVWSSIVDSIDQPGHDDDWITVADMDREQLATHPWSLTGGGAVELQAAVEKAATARLAAVTDSIGITCFTLEDDAYIADPHAFRRRGIPGDALRLMVLGDGLRDWRSGDQPAALFPYNMKFEPQDPGAVVLRRWLWRYRTNLSNSIMFGRETKVAAGLHWYEYGRLTANKLKNPLSIAFAFVATHNHFVLDRGGKVFNRSAPVIKLPEGATEEDHLALLGVLNSSTACFWLKQNSHNKGSTVDTKGARQTQVPWEDFYEFTGTTLQDFPLPTELPTHRVARIQDAAERAAFVLPSAALERDAPTRALLDQVRHLWQEERALAVFHQEELDWEVYRLYGLIDEDLTYPGEVRLELGQRAFEIRLARRVAAGEEETAWFERHRSTPITKFPAEWPDDYRALITRRIELAESHRYLRLLERPEHKRRWAMEPWEVLEERALRGWLLDRLEEPELWSDPQGRPRPTSVAQLADHVTTDAELLGVLELWCGRTGVDVAKELGRLVADEHVPYLARLRYKPSGLRKRVAWEETWDLQRQEDAGIDVGTIPVPPKYTSADFAKPSYWKNRGKLDVPKERFVSYPGAGRDADPTLLLGWAGWDHAEQALALANLVNERVSKDAWGDDRITPLLAGIVELEPWLHQWHTEPQAEYGGQSMAQIITDTLDGELASRHLTREQL